MPRGYDSSEILRMQRDAELRVREMRSRARTVAQEGDLPLPPENRNWSTATGRSRQLPSQPLRPPQPASRGQNPRPEPPRASARQESAPAADTPAPRAPVPPAPKGDGTLLGDLLGATGIGEDTLLIIGLILILMNQKADTTLLLALGYLLLPDGLL